MATTDVDLPAEVYLQGGLSIQREILLDLVATLSVDTGLGFNRQIDLDLLAELQVQAGIATFQTLDADLREEIVLADGINARDGAKIQYAVNAETGAATLYDEFHFNGFTVLNGFTYAIADDGLYRIEHTDDTVRLEVDFGAMSFGTNQMKRVSEAFLDLHTDGAVYLRVRVDEGEQYSYLCRGDEHQLRGFFGRGLVGKNWRITLSISDASIAELECVELEVGAVQRRLHGRHRS